MPPEVLAERAKQKAEKAQRRADRAAHLAKVKVWNKAMATIKDEWRTQLLTKAKAKAAADRAQEISKLRASELQTATSRQAQSAMQQELRKTELAVELVRTGTLIAEP